MSDAGPPGSQLERWIGVAATIIAPATLLSAVLFYFGYVSSRSQYEYFGVDVDTIGLSTRDYVMRSPQPLLVPLLALALAAAALVAGHAAVRGRIADPAAAAGLRRAARAAVALGAVLLGVGVLLLLGYGYVRSWDQYELVTPLLIGAGAGTVGYASRVLRLSRGPAPDAPVLLRRLAGVLVLVVVATSIFWSVATVAQWSGRGLARYDAQHLDRLPSVILDTKERLFLRSPGIEETALPAAEGQTFRYRYRRMRLLIQGHDRMFLVPERWSASNSTLIVPLDDGVRVQFQFRNDPP